jgi:hypothetical protein
LKQRKENIGWSAFAGKEKELEQAERGYSKGTSPLSAVL